MHCNYMYMYSTPGEKKLHVHVVHIYCSTHMYTGVYFLAVPDVLPDIPGSDRRRDPDERLYPDHGMSHDFDEAS